MIKVNMVEMNFLILFDPTPDSLFLLYKAVDREIVKEDIWCYFWDNFSYFSIKTYVVGTH